MPPLEVPTLEGRIVRLEPISIAHVEELAIAASLDRSTFRYLRVPNGRASMEAEIESLLEEAESGQVISFAQVRVADGTAVGMTRYLAIEHRPGAPLPYSLEIGGTWIGAEAQRTGLNVEAKLLLFAHAFDVLSVRRVSLKGDARNERSRSAITALGATFEGVLRSWQPSHVIGEEDALRDTMYFSVLREEWPAVRNRLQMRLDRYR
ncbi:MAG TPA: GNAT family protein [Acidimicrobiales bacterium]|jgi:RimJ/RimL family protein N-acetyltransferase|nr:GNAT family protein [Acidimicrobiales bacterium]